MDKVTLQLTSISIDEAQRILSFLERPAAFGYLIWHATEGALVSENITVKDNDPPVTCYASFQDVEGATVDVTAAWAADDDQVAIITLDPENDQKVTIEPGVPGASVIHCVGHNPDGTSVELVGTFTVIPSDAVVGKLDFQPGT